MKKLFKRLILFVLVIAVLLGAAYYGAKALYPVKYIDYINKYAQEYDIDPYFVMSIIKAESNFKTEAVSNKNATGLMQITEETAIWIADKLEIDDFEYENDISDPELNIRMGSYYIAYLIDMYDGCEDCALAAYNAGFSNVDRWLSDEKYSEDGKALDKIPFPETERYVNKVKNNYKIYKFLYKEATD